MRIVYTDGACLGNPGPGGWAWAVPDGPYAAGPDPATTNQRMEIRAALEAVRTLDGPLEVVSDSTYVVNCFRDRWWEGWLARDWHNSAKKPVANRDLWEPLIDAYRADPQRLRFRWVKGHSNDTYNDLVDRLAVEAARTQSAASGVGTPTVPASPPRDTGPAGHRLVIAGPRIELDPATANRLQEIVTAKASMHDDLVVVTGVRFGAEVAGAVGVPFVVVLPYPWKMPSSFEQAREQILLQPTVPESKQKTAAALARRDAWLARHAHEAVVVWDGREEYVGRLVRSFRDHLGDEEVWVIEPA